LKRSTKILVLTDTVAFSDVRALRSAIESVKAGYRVHYVSREGEGRVPLDRDTDKIEARKTRILPFTEDGDYKKQFQILSWLLYKYPVAFNLKAFFLLQLFMLFQIALLQKKGWAQFGAYILLLVLSPVSLLAIVYIFISRLFRPSRVADADPRAKREQAHTLRTWLEQSGSDEVYVLRSLIFRSLEIYYSCRAEIGELQPDIIHAHDIVNLPAAIWIASMVGAKVIYDAHELEVFRNTPKSQPWRQIVYKLERHFVKKTNAVISVSEGYAKELGKLYPGVAPKIVHNVPSYYGAGGKEGGDLRKLSGVPDDAGLAVFVGHLRLDRGIRIYLDAMSDIPDLHLVICGPSKEHASLVLADDLSAKGLHGRVHFAGRIPPRELVKTLVSADFSIIPTQPTSKAIIGAMPNKFFESAFAGVPVIVDERVEGMSELVKEYRLGVCTLSSDRERLIADLLYLKNTRQALASVMLTDKFIARFNWDAQARELLSVLASVETSGVPYA